MNEAQQPSLPSETTIDVSWPRTGIACVVLAGEHGLATAGELDKTLSETLEGCSRLIVDLRDSEFIDSAVIRTLLSAKRRAESSSRPFSIVLATTPIVERALAITGVLPELNRVHTLEEALSPNDVPPTVVGGKSSGASRSFDVHLLLLHGRGVDTSGTFTGPLPAADDLIDVRCRSRRIHPARVTRLDPPGRFPIWADEVEIETFAAGR